MGTIHRHPWGCPTRVAIGVAADPPFTFHVKDRDGTRTRVMRSCSAPPDHSATRPLNERIDAFKCGRRDSNPHFRLGIAESWPLNDGHLNTPRRAPEDTARGQEESKHARQDLNPHLMDLESTALPLSYTRRHAMNCTDWSRTNNRLLNREPHYRCATAQ